jgi:protein-disulfide isomerase
MAKRYARVGFALVLMACLTSGYFLSKRLRASTKGGEAAPKCGAAEPAPLAIGDQDLARWRKAPMPAAVTGAQTAGRWVDLLATPGNRNIEKIRQLPAAAGEMVVKVLNSRPCNCGCPFGTLAQCLKDDVKCPQSPRLTDLLVRLAQQGEPEGVLLAALEQHNHRPKPDEELNERNFSQIQRIVKVTPPPSAVTTGPPSAKTEVVVFEDLQCPFCKRFAGVLEELQEKHKGEVRLTRLHFPLNNHKRARSAGLAVQAARRMGKGPEMMQRLYEHQTGLQEADLVEHAQAIGLPRAEFQTVMASADIPREVDRHVEVGHAAGVRYTPTTFVNGHPIVGAVRLADLERAMSMDKKP